MVAGGRLLAIRWTIGDVNDRGYVALRFSIWGAWRIFGAAARYRVYVNTLAVDEVRRRTGPLPEAIEWQAAERSLPDWLARRIDPAFAEGVAWKFAPIRAFPADHELALDNDVILWGRPRALDEWLAGHSPFVLAEDVHRGYGAFDDLCPLHPLNTGIRGLPPDFDFERALRALVAKRPAEVSREVDEQGLQVATLARAGRFSIITCDEVTICSPFPPHRASLGRAGAHFVGLNARNIPFEFDGRPAVVVRAEHWDRLIPDVEQRLGCG
jgi:hypothetical protein